MGEHHIKQLERRNRELSILNSIADALNREADLTRALNAVLARVAELLDLETGWVYLWDESKRKFYTAATQNLPPALGNNPRRLGGTCYCLDSYSEGDMEGAANVNVIECSRLEHLIDGTDGLRYHASIPLYAQGKELGVLNVASADWRELSAEDLRLLYTVGDMVSIAIERAKLFASSVQLGAAEERNRLAREIHDTLAQSLTGITLQLETADTLLDGRNDIQRAQKIIQQTLALARESIEDARRSVLDLRAAPLEGRTLPEALEKLVTQTKERHIPCADFEVIGGGTLSARIEVGLYRIAQEAIQNILRHAKAEWLSVQLTLMPDQVELEIEDNGCGFDPDEIPGGHFGLIGMKERVKLLGGTLTIRSGQDIGTRIVASIPLGRKS